MADFPLLTPDQASPIFSGMNAYHQMMQNMYLQPQLQQELQKQKLANALSQVQLPYAGPQAAAQLAYSQAQTPYLQAQTNYLGQQSKYYGPEVNARIALQNAQAAKEKLYSQYPELMAGGIGSELLGAKLFQDRMKQAGQQDVSPSPINAPAVVPTSVNAPSLQPTSINPAAGMTPPTVPMNAPQINQPEKPKTWIDIANQMLQTKFEKPLVEMERSKQLTTGAPYLTLPAPEKNWMLAQARALGIPGAEASSEFIKGKSILDLAEKQGFPRDYSKLPQPSYAATTSSLTNAQRRASSLAELKAIDDFAVNAQAPYAQRFAGFSPLEVMQKFKDTFGTLPEKEKKQLIDFTAANMVMPDVNVLRPKMMGMQNIGVEAMREISKAAHNRWKTMESTMSPELFREATKKANQLMEKMVNAGNKAIFSPEQADVTASSQPTITGQMVKIQTPKGKTLMVPADKAEQLLKDHPDHMRVG
jgi:hypothetical protein